MKVRGREIAERYRSADSYSDVVSAMRQLLGSLAVFWGAIGVGVATASFGPILRAAAMLAFLSGFVGMVRLFVVGVRLNADVGFSSHMPAAVSWWFWLFMLRDAVTPRSRWRAPRRGEDVT